MKKFLKRMVDSYVNIHGNYPSHHKIYIKNQAKLFEEIIRRIEELDKTSPDENVGKNDNA